MRRNMKYKALTLKQKLSAIEEVETGKLIKDVAEKYEIPANTLSNIRKHKDKIRRKIQKNPNMQSRKRLRTGKYDLIDNAIETFVSEARNNNVPINGKIIREKAFQYGQALNCDEFNASNGWFEGLKNRIGLKWRCLTGDAAECNKGVAADWIESTLKPLLSIYDENDIFNGDETGLFYKCLPGKSFTLKGDSCQKGKHSKQRVTLMLCANMSGTEKLTPLLIGKYRRPHCFKNIHSLPLEYEFNSKAWMNTSIFEKWLLRLDDEFGKQNRKVLFFFDNCSAHKKDMQSKLKNTKLEFFPPNLTALLQPMDMGIIRCLKVHYRNNLVKEILDSIKSQQQWPQITLLDCINHISKIWSTKISASIIQSCFQKAWFYDGNFMDDDNVRLQQLGEEAENNYNSLRLVSGISEEFEEYIHCDSEVICSHLMNDEDIIENVINESFSIMESENNNEVFEMEDVCLTSTKKVTYLEMREAAKTLINGLLQRKSVSPRFFNILHEIEEFLEKDTS